MEEQSGSLKKGYILMFITVVIFGIEMVLQKWLLNGDVLVNSLCMFSLFFIVLFSELILLFSKIISKIKNKTSDRDGNGIVSVSNEKSGAKVINKKEYYTMLLLMAIFCALNYFFYTNGLNMTKATIAEFVNAVATSMAVIVCLAIFKRSERRQLKNKFVIAAFIVSIIGIYFANGYDLSNLSEFKFDLGLLCFFVSATAWGFYVLIYTNFENRISKFRIMSDVHLGAAVIYGTYLLVNHSLLTTLSIGWMNVFKIGILTLIIDIGTFLTYFEALRLVSGVTATIFTLSSPIITYVLAFLILHERINSMQFWGCFLLLMSNVLLVLKEIYKQKE